MEGMPEWKSSAEPPDISSFVDVEYVKDAYLEGILNGKRVAYVGPSAHLVGSRSGRDIDSYDVIIRTNLCDNSAMYDDYGSRTDVIAHSFNELEMVAARRNMDFLKKMKFVMCSMVSNDTAAEQELLFDALRMEGVPVQNVGDEYLLKLFREVGTVCNCGFVCILLMLKYDIAELYVTGVNFYNMGKYGKIYNDDYYDVVTRESKLYAANADKNVTADQARNDLHDQGKQIEYFKKLLLSDPRLKVDSYLKENL